MHALCTTLFLASLFLVSSFSCAAEIDTPAGYTVQVLDVTNGEVARPDGWFYGFFTEENSIVWTISKEDSKVGPYQTGMRVQFWPSLERTKVKSVRELVGRLIESKRKSTKVERLCDEESSGDFRRICMETTEPSSEPDGSFRILYTFSWSEEKNALAITTFGAPEQDWEDLKGTIQTMSRMILIGKDFWATKRE